MRASALPVALRFARRELRGGIKGFRIFIACLAIGVAAIAGAGSLNSALRTALDGDARALLGGDLELRLSSRPAGEEQIAHLGDHAVVSPTVAMRAMAYAGQARTLVEMKGVEGNYPLYGALVLDPPMTVDEALAPADGVWGAAADANLMSRLGIQRGDRFRVGDAQFQLRATILKEPDRVATVFTFGPRLMAANEAVAETGLVQPGSLVRYGYQLRLTDGSTVADFKADLAQRFPDAGWHMRDSDDAAPGVKRFLDNMTVFLTLVGLTSLLVGGIGVANAVKAYIDGRVTTIAILKCVGAQSGTIFAAYFTLIALLAAVGILIGLVIGAVIPIGGVAVLGDAMPVEARLGIYPKPLAVAAGFGALIALSFGLWPLARAKAIPAATLFRDSVAPGEGRPAGAMLWAIGAAVAALAALTILSSENRGLAAWFVGAAVLSLGLFRLVAGLVRRAARAAALRRRGTAGHVGMRLALANLHRPGAATVSVVLSLGLGMTVLVAIALIEGNLSRQINERVPLEAPAFFFIDIQQDQAERFDAAVKAADPTAETQRAAMVRGRISKLNGIPSDQVTIAPEAEWAVRGDRGLSMAATPPADSRIVAGTWWPQDYQGPPLVSMDANIARGLGLKVGDTVTINVLGRDLTATIASLREIDWASLSMNFTFILSPGSLAGAPHSYIATVRAEPQAEEAVEKRVTDLLPNVSSIRVKEALDALKTVVASAGAAVRAAAGITLVAGALVLAGAVAAGHRRRVYEAVVLKVLGATRRDLWRAFLIEYGILGMATGLIAGLIGSLAAWAILVLVMHAHWQFLPGIAAATVAICLAATLLIGFAGTWHALGAKVSPYLRND